MFSDMDFAQRLKTARERAGLSQSELAAQCGLTIRSISAYETGRANPRGVTLHKLAAALGVSRQTIISLENGKYNPSILLAHAIARLFGTQIEDIFLFEEEEA